MAGLWRSDRVTLGRGHTSLSALIEHAEEVFFSPNINSRWSAGKKAGGP